MEIIELIGLAKQNRRFQNDILQERLSYSVVQYRQLQTSKLQGAQWIKPFSSPLCAVLYPNENLLTSCKVL